MVGRTTEDRFGIRLAGFSIEIDDHRLGRIRRLIAMETTDGWISSAEDNETVEIKVQLPGLGHDPWREEVPSIVWIVGSSGCLSKDQGC